jgi:hypothetical protein
MGSGGPPICALQSRYVGAAPDLAAGLGAAGLGAGAACRRGQPAECRAGVTAAHPWGAACLPWQPGSQRARQPASQGAARGSPHLLGRGCRCSRLLLLLLLLLLLGSGCSCGGLLPIRRHIHHLCSSGNGRRQGRQGRHGRHSSGVRSYQQRSHRLLPPRPASAPWEPVRRGVAAVTAPPPCLPPSHPPAQTHLSLPPHCRCSKCASHAAHAWSLQPGKSRAARARPSGAAVVDNVKKRG